VKKEIAELENNQVTELKDEQESRKTATRSMQPEVKDIPLRTWISSLDHDTAAPQVTGVHRSSL
jgi:hypothetical protein